jgi:hypothetical protein
MTDSDPHAKLLRHVEGGTGLPPEVARHEISSFVTVGVDTRSATVLAPTCTTSRNDDCSGLLCCNFVFVLAGAAAACYGLFYGLTEQSSLHAKYAAEAPVLFPCNATAAEKYNCGIRFPQNCYRATWSCYCHANATQDFTCHADGPDQIEVGDTVELTRECANPAAQLVSFRTQIIVASVALAVLGTVCLACIFSCAKRQCQCSLFATRQEEFLVVT